MIWLIACVTISAIAKSIIVRGVELVFATTEWKDAGTYTCLAKEVGSGDPPTRKDFRLEVLGPPKAIAHVSGRGSRGESSEMSCTFLGRPLTNVQWLLNGKRVDEDPDKFEIFTEKKADNEVKAYLKILK